MPIVSESGFAPSEEHRYLSPEDLSRTNESYLAVHLSNDSDPSALAPEFDRIALIAIDFPSFADGRGFSLAKRLRDLGYEGHLRAKGPLIVDQLVMARRVGFDDIEISAEMAERQPEALWTNALRNASYRERLRQRAC
ncbi:MAG: DUF934 domain-containing protein [Neomegalonema sp.]|nr:DUF934 domain-containing protein [Neomegalonema sp.]